jgi:AcrR family transcriptional regulator
LLIEGGAAAVTFEAVARRAKAGKPTIYRWWPTKAALLLEVYDRHKDRVVTAPNLGDFRSDLIVLTQALWTFWRETSGGSAFAAIIAEAQSNRETQHTLVNHYADGTRNHINSLNIIIEQAIVRGELANGTDVQRVREAIMAMNWFHLLCGKLDQERIPDVVGRLVDGVLSK